MRTLTMWITGVDIELKNQFKGMCGLRGEAMNDVFEALMQAYISKPEDFVVMSKRERKTNLNSIYTESKNGRFKNADSKRRK